MPENTNSIIALQSTPESVQVAMCLPDQIASPGAASEAEIQNARMDAALAIRALLEPRIQNRKGFRRFQRLNILVPICSISLLACLYFVLPHLPEYMKVWAILALVPVAGLVSVVAIMQLPLISDLFFPPTSQIQPLLQVDDKRMIPLLMDARTLVAGHVMGTEITKVLSRLLPMLQATDAALLTAEHREQLNQYLVLAGGSFLESIVATDHTVAILKGLQQIGDHTSLPHVERLARTSRNSRIREAAQECLPFLKQRATLQDQTLLHPSSRPEPNADLLLRPAGSGVASEQDRLLRAELSEKTST